LTTPPRKLYNLRMAPVAPLFNPNQFVTVAASKKATLYGGGWIAIWRTPKGNFIHVQLPAELITRADAEAYARSTATPEWTAR
jgi:hypothetical protein